MIDTCMGYGQNNMIHTWGIASGKSAGNEKIPERMNQDRVPDGTGLQRQDRKKTADAKIKSELKHKKQKIHSWTEMSERE